MSNTTAVLAFSIGIIVLVVAVSVVYVILENKKKKKVQKSFRNFSQEYKETKQNLRAVPRVSVPEPLDVLLTLTDNDYFGLKARALDISLSGFSVKPDFPLKKLPLNITVNNVLVVTPINTFVIKEMRTVRIDHQIEKRLMAFHVQQIDEDQFENLKQFMGYLDEFLKQSAIRTETG